MNGRGRRAKGSNFELKIAEKFTNVFKTNFRRTPLSGGFDKSMIQGDIFSANKKFSLVIECKNHKTFSVPEWWKQVRDDAPRWKIPLLVMYFSGTYHTSKTYPFKRNQTGDMILLRYKDYRKLKKLSVELRTTTFVDNKLSMPKYINEIINGGRDAVVITSPVLTGKSDTYILLTLDTFFESIYVNRCFKRIIAIKNRQTN